MSKGTGIGPCFLGEVAFDGRREKELLCDPDHRRYSRGARHESSLPDSDTNTKLIKKLKSWKHRTKRERQWIPQDGEHWREENE